MTQKDPARAGYMVMTLARFSGVAMVLLGIVITQGEVQAPPALGYVALAIGLLTTFFAPGLLARHWRTPSE